MQITQFIYQKMRGCVRAFRLHYDFEVSELVFGAHPEIPRFVTSQKSPWYTKISRILERCRSFAYDLRVFKELEPEINYLSHLIEPGKDSLDVGANVGYYSAYMAPCSRFVYTFEANRRIIPFLQISLSAYDNCIVLPLAVGATPGTAVFYIPDKGPDPLQWSGSGGFHTRLMDKRKTALIAMPVRVVALDSFQFDNVGCIKIDVEGSEYDVLAGANDTIKRNRPNIIIENEYRHNPECENVFTFLLQRDYQGYFIHRPTKRLLPFEKFSLKKDQKDLVDANLDITDPENYIFSFIFVPKEKDCLRIFVTGSSTLFNRM